METANIEINTVLISAQGQAIRVRSGDTIPDADTQARVAVAGGQMAPASDSIIASAAIIVGKLRRSRSSDDQLCDTLMLAAYTASLAAAIPTAGNMVRVGGASGVASPYNANPGDVVIADTSTGSVVVNLPVLALRQAVQVKHDENTSLAANTVTVNGPAGVNLAEPPPNNGSFVAAYEFGAGFGGQNDRGTDLTWFNAGSGGGYVLE